MVGIGLQRKQISGTFIADECFSRNADVNLIDGLTFNTGTTVTGGGTAGTQNFRDSALRVTREGGFVTISGTVDNYASNHVHYSGWATVATWGDADSDSAVAKMLVPRNTPASGDIAAYGTCLHLAHTEGTDIFSRSIACRVRRTGANAYALEVSGIQETVESQMGFSVAPNMLINIRYPASELRNPNAFN